MKNIIINVDDLGLSEPINQAVINLAKRRVISSTSYMVGGAISQSHITTLHNLQIEVGLHLDFTGINPSHLTGSLSSILLKTYLRRFNHKEVTHNIKKQFDDFEDCFNQSPTFVDGHQHVHQFPMIRDILINEITQRSNDDAPIAARNTKPIMPDFKSHIIYTLGGHRWQALCRQHNIWVNDTFAGVYNFDASIAQLQNLWKIWIQQSLPSTPSTDGSQQPKHLIMCHPALPDTADTWSDDIKTARELEYQWLISDEFTALLERSDVMVSGFKNNN